MSDSGKGFDRRSVLKGVGALLGGAAASPRLVAAEPTGQYVVSARGKGAGRRLEKAGFTVTRELAGGRVLLVAGGDDPASVNGIKNATRDVRLRLERPSRSAPLPKGTAETRAESLYPRQWDKQTTHAAAAHDVTTGEGATVAVIDTGSDLDHPDLAPNLVPGALFRRVAGTGPDDGVFTDSGVDVRLPEDPLTAADEVTDGGGAVVGYDPDAFEVTDDRHPSDDVDGHGSHVAGIAAASVGEEVDDGFTGVAGTAPDATVVPHRVFYWERQEVTFEGDGGERTEELVVTSTTTADVLAAIDFAANEVGVDAMNLSIGTPPLPPQLNSEGFRGAYRQVIQDAVSSDSVVVVSAGNSGTELNQGGAFTTPNSVPGATSVSATGPDDERAFYSNYGANEITLGAPGGGYETLEKTLSRDTEWPYPTNLVLSTTPPDVYGAAHSYFAGTSMAAPQVTGAAALVATANPDLSATQVESVLENSASDVSGQRRDDVGAGVLDVAAAVRAATDRR
ncbi:S8 family serine peptidase [Haloarcula nitratireducens]|uniref:S8 family serine peptidase n=1 Tax=Haloarcula nitratireducens TaxID=2487749 RepID=A0AAW4PHT4_9EURY|nr:S8 family serine peptidase [Halomicroarcula nitratireducens]MBX0297193.1 S8 family serine peptidase [Halomicroarcula nitratireducens]